MNNSVQSQMANSEFWTLMIGYWQSFKVGFCKVEFLCYAQEPNWLGWIIIGILCLTVFFGIIGFVAAEVSNYKR